GKGFTVVADEIKKLATQTGDATTLVEQLISTVQQEIKQTNQNITLIDDQVKATIKNSKESMQAVSLVIDVSKTISYILNIMNEQNLAISEVRGNISEMAIKSEKNAVVSEEYSKQAILLINNITKQTDKLNRVLEDLEFSSDGLADMVAAFKVV
ncbi:MAG: methyl-accepting chemotaxis protein, partial [Anaerocolumna sp.]|nr:methyl-accepting chemotaxis protein [Anaerocolumna sp.]